MNKLEFLEAIKNLSVHQLHHELKRLNKRLQEKQYNAIEDLLEARILIQNELSSR